MNNKPEIAIIESNTLTCLGLKSILEEIIPMATIRTFHSFNELMDDTPDMYAHYFISAQIYVEHNAFFLPRKRKTIVLASDSPQFQLSGVPVLNIYEPEEKLVKSLLKLHQHAHHNGYPVKDMPPIAMPEVHQEILSVREIEVLVLITKGLINKEIADKLNISPDYRHHPQEKHHGKTWNQVCIRINHLCSNERIHRGGPNLIS